MSRGIPGLNSFFSLKILYAAKRLDQLLLSDATFTKRFCEYSDNSNYTHWGRRILYIVFYFRWQLSRQALSMGFLELSEIWNKDNCQTVQKINQNTQEFKIWRFLFGQSQKNVYTFSAQLYAFDKATSRHTCNVRNIFFDFFLNKIAPIRNELDSQSSAPHPLAKPFGGNLFLYFPTGLWKHCAWICEQISPKTCELCPMHSSARWMPGCCTAWPDWNH